MKETVGIGIIGTGFAKRVQIPSFLRCEGARVVSVASGSIENARLTADEFGIGHATGDWRETIEHPDVDLVCVTTPPNVHREMTLAVIEAGKHILCEKPMAMNVAEASEMLAVAEVAAAAGRPMLALIDHELRFQPGRLTAYKMLREGAIGKVRHAKATFQAPHRGDPNIPWNWWSDEAVGGGALGAIGSHVIDSFHWLLDTEVASVFCQLQTHIPKRKDASGISREVTSDDATSLVLRFNDGILTENTTGVATVSMTDGPDYQNLMEFFGTDGFMRIDHLGGIAIANPGESEWTPLEVDRGTLLPGMPDTGFARAFVEIAPRVVDAIRNGETTIEHAATFADGVRVQSVLDAARRSNSTGRLTYP
ncbi:MAG: Gfo/Idh/MocA family oxidoreductase [Pyrinomonadaceae bacterium]|nr:Gfo/Idh/MocA family oxidoreductase [Pyrinomonadaceae bacterium]MBP9109717.1 Gfo/Idh/MocA family oxidoreductase [Pyrinomonadaceae bacterium]